MSIAGHRPMHPDLIGQTVTGLAVFCQCLPRCVVKLVLIMKKNSFVMKHLMSICNTSLVVKDAVLHISHNDSYDLLRNMSSY